MSLRVAEGRQSSRVRWVLRLNWRSWSFDLQFTMSRLDLRFVFDLFYVHILDVYINMCNCILPRICLMGLLSQLG